MVNKNKGKINQDDYVAKFEELRTIFDNLPEGIVVLLDKEMNVVAANQTISGLLGYNMGDIVGNNSDQLFKQNFQGLSEVVKETIQNKRAVKNFTVECNTKKWRYKKFSC